MSEGKYDDIIKLPHHVSERHLQMSLEERSAQFAPFAALTGYEDAVEETARITDEWIDIDEDIKSKLDEKMQEICKVIADKPLVTVTYFAADSKKNGGKYLTVSGNLKQIDNVRQVVIFNNGTEIAIRDIFDIKR